MKPGSVGERNILLANLEALEAAGNIEPAQRELLETLRRQWAEQRAERRTQFERNRTPLFAEQIPAAQPEQYIEAAKRNAQSWHDLQTQHQNFAIARRQDVASAVSAEDLDAMDERWNRFQGPHNPTYEADFWLQRYRETFHKNPPDVGYVVSDADGARYEYGAPWPPPHHERWNLDPAAIDAQKQKRISPPLFGGE